MGTLPELLIGDAEGQHLAVIALHRKHPGLFDYADGNWVACDIRIAAGGFRGSIHADLRAEEFQDYLEQASVLRDAPGGTATFSTLEQQLQFSLSGDGRGPVRVEGHAGDAPGGSNRLHFSFEIDQAGVAEMCASLAAVVAAFPVVGASEPTDA
jgi:hypothetical protein